MNDDPKKNPDEREPEPSIFEDAVRPTDPPPKKELPTRDVPDLGGEID